MKLTVLLVMTMVVTTTSAIKCYDKISDDPDAGPGSKTLQCRQYCLKASAYSKVYIPEFGQSFTRGITYGCGDGYCTKDECQHRNGAVGCCCSNKDKCNSTGRKMISMMLFTVVLAKYFV